MYEQPYWISGLSVPEVVNLLEEQDFVCEGPNPRGETMHTWECSERSGEQSFGREVSIVGREPEEVRSVTARIFVEGGMPPEEDAAEFLGAVASMPYEGVESAQVRQWVNDTLSSGGKLTMGSATLELVSEEHSHTLRIVSSEGSSR